ncbi:MAG TPA: TonB C-terminal domain-containing protein, partial [Candidatus Limnocylindrales bacterium]|nr:TonB C-terminal domain-containing protein [Candidatus Limnocylindrales bacterium]
MNRLQKKCLIATAGFHLLLLVILLVGPGFFAAKPKPDDTQVLDVIPANLIDAAFSSGVKGAQPPPPTPIVKPPEPQPQPTPEPPKPVVKPEPVKPPDPEPVKLPDKLPPDDLKPVVKPLTKPPEHIIKPDLKPIVRKTPPKDTDNSAAEAKEQKRLRDQRIKAFQNAARSIKDNSSKSTIVDMPGESDSAYAPYKDAIGSIYYNAWTPPDDVANDDSNTKVSITIARDGTIISSRIITPSGDSRMDASVQR